MCTNPITSFSLATPFRFVILCSLLLTTCVLHLGIIILPLKSSPAIAPTTGKPTTTTSHYRKLCHFDRIERLQPNRQGLCCYVGGASACERTGGDATPPVCREDGPASREGRHSKLRHLVGGMNVRCTRDERAAEKGRSKKGKLRPKREWVWRSRMTERVRYRKDHWIVMLVRLKGCCVSRKHTLCWLLEVDVLELTDGSSFCCSSGSHPGCHKLLSFEGGLHNQHAHRVPC
jgi:hypothetical protein